MADNSETALLSVRDSSGLDAAARKSDTAADQTLLFASDGNLDGSSLNPAEGNKEDTDQGPAQRNGWLSLPYLQSYVYFASYISLGLTVGSTGPTLELLGKNTNSTTDEVGTVFTARGVGWIAGSLCAGAVNLFELHSIAAHHVMLLSVAMLSIYLFVIPFMKSLWLLLLSMTISSVACSFIDVGVNVLLFAVWKNRAGPWMQALHFCFGVGASIAPAIVALIMRLVSLERQLFVACYTLGALSLLTALTLYVPSPRGGKQQESAKKGQTLSKRREIMLIIMTSLFLFVYLGIASSYSGWIFTYARDNFPAMEEWQAASLASAYWLAVTAGRLLAVLLTIYLPNRTLLLLDLLVCLPVGFILSLGTFISILRNRILLWGLTFLYGLGMASIFATVFSLPSEQGVAVTSSASSWFIVGASCGDMAIPAALGFFIVRWSSSLAWAVLIATLVLFALYASLMLSMRYWTTNPTRVVENERYEQSAALAETTDVNDL